MAFPMLLRFVLTVLILGNFSSVLSISSVQQKNEVRHYQENDKLGAVASESAVCSRIGVDLIKAGGNAADAVCIQIQWPHHPKKPLMSRTRKAGWHSILRWCHW